MSKVKTKEKKQKQLGMNPSTAANRLTKDILFAFIQADEHVCHQCGGELTREDFSIEHIVPWLDSENPKELYFDLNNIAFSHLKCNVGAARSPKKSHPSFQAYREGCRCEGCTQANREMVAKYRKNKKLKMS